MNQRNEVRNGAILSYLLIFINMAYGLLITPFILKYIGSTDYGVFKSVSSLSASLAVLDLGLGSTMTRYMSKYNAEKDHGEANNFAAMVFVQYLFLALAIAVAGILLFFSLDNLYDASFSAEALRLAQHLFGFLILNLILRLFENLLIGIANGFEHFTVSNGVRIISLLIKIMLILVFLPLTHNIMVTVALEALITLAANVFLLFYITRRIGIVPRLVRWDQKLFRESFGYTGLMFLQTLTIQFNGNVDNVLIGAKLGAASVTVYSMALQLFGMYETLSGSVANIMLPTMTKKVVQGQSGAQLQQTVEKCGRLQFAVLSAALGGFIVLGKDFFYLWLGEGYGDCYYIALMLIIPVTFTMVQNVSLSVLRAQNKMVYRTVTLLISCSINVLITAIGLNYWGYWGAALGTVVATICNLVFMNTYYHIKLGFKVFSLFRNIMQRTLPCAAATTVITFGLHTMFHGTWMAFLINAAVFMAIYLALLFLWGLGQEEKQFLLGRFVSRRT